jgi:hypothetical protein
MLDEDMTLREEVVTAIRGDRRSRRRYPIELPVQFRVLKSCLLVQAGTGQTINISSGGIAFATSERLPLRAHVELSIAWPCKLNNICPLKLVAIGRVVRSQEGSTVIRIERHEFRTQGSAAQPMRPLAMLAGG